MLKSLHIENIAVIEQTDIVFSDGLNVLTGETGAGKSIVIDAINAILGERTSKELIRAGAETALVSAIFCELSGYAKNALEDAGFSVDSDGNLLITRTLTHSGGTVKINGLPATVGILKTIGKHLINIHGQHDNQSLLDPDTHYIYIDRLADNSVVLREYYDEFHHLNTVRKELSGFETDEAQKKRDIELLEYQIKELTDADIKPGETEVLKSKLEIARNAENTLNGLKTAYSCLNGNEDSDGAFSSVQNAQKEIANCKGEEFEQLNAKFYELLSGLDEVIGQIRRLINNGDGFGIDAESLRARLDIISRITLKYGGSEEKAKEYLENAEKRLNNIHLSETRITELSKELDESTERLVILGKKVTASRIEAAKIVEKNVTEILSFLDMPNVTFKVSVVQGKYTRYGCDNVEFMIGTNAGEAIKPLSKIASGGELSRVMLAIKSVLADKDDVDTLIFDEIDAGIGGRAAQKVGHQLKQVSSDRQTVCVTHLAQIATFAQNHLLIEKSVKDNRTYTSVKPLAGDDRIKEIARIMAGSNMSENIYNSAKELLERNF